MSQIVHSDRSVNPAYQKAVEELSKNLGQWQVFESTGHCVVLAGPGSGKTKTLTAKLVRLLQEDVHLPRGIACLTYNNECARELQRRLEKLGITARRNAFVGTVHSFCMVNVVAPYGRLASLNIPDSIVVASPNEQKKHWDTALQKVYGTAKKPSNTELDYYRRTYLDRDNEEWKTRNETIAYSIELYEEELRHHGLIDFDDMILLGLHLVEKNEWIRQLLKARFPVLVIDEYQDLGLSLHRLVNSLCFNAGMRLLAVGDPDQSIYGFTGAQPHLLQELSERHDVEKVYLNINYRCGTNIVRAAELILNKDEGMFTTPTEAPEGIIFYHKCAGGLEEQATKICKELIPQVLTNQTARKLGDIAVLYIDKNDGDIIAKAATKEGINFIRIDGNAPYKKTPLTRWLEDCALWCTRGWSDGKPRLSDLVHNWMNFNKVQAVSDTQCRILKRNLVRFLWSNRKPDIPLCDWLDDFYQSCLSVTFFSGCPQNDEYEALAQLISACSDRGKIHNFTLNVFAGQGGSPNHLNLITLHSAKGLEYEVVMIMGLDQGKIPWTNDSQEKRAEKRRLFYVGITRAKYEVHLTFSGWYLRFDKKCELGPSEFVRELQKKVLEGSSIVKSPAANI
jgi:DNA helicase-2/ATP-dependent DNA helicase PcrA